MGNEHLTEAEIEQIVRRTVRQTLTELGVEASDPVRMQRDFQWLRDWRETSESVRRKGLLTIIGILVAGTLGALWMGLQHALTGR